MLLISNRSRKGHKLSTAESRAKYELEERVDLKQFRTTIYVTRKEEDALRVLIEFCTTMAKELGTSFYDEQLEHANDLHQKIKNSRYGGE